MLLQHKYMKKRIAILGGGVQGIALLRELNLNGHECTLFESKPEIGGVWTNSNDIPYLSLQINSRHYRFPDFKWSRSINSPTASQVCEYLNAYIDNYKLRKYIRVSTPVLDIEEKNDSITLKLNNNKTYETDYVICTGQSSIPNIPQIYLNHSNVIHTSNLSRKNLLSSNGKNCVVIGGSKSAADAVYNLEKYGANVTWVARKFYTYAPCNEETSISAMHIVSKIPEMLLTGSSNPIFSLRINDDDILQSGTGNILTSQEYHRLRLSNKIRSDIIDVKYDSIVLKNGKNIPCDMIVLATGYHENKCRLSEKVPFNLNKLSIIESLPGTRNLITSFGVCNSVLIASGFNSWINSDTNLSFNEWWEKVAKPSKNLPLIIYQIRYLLTSGNISRFKVDEPSLQVDFILILTIILLILIICIIIARKR